MTSSTRRRLHSRRHVPVVDIGCGCRRSKLSSLFSSSSSFGPKPKTHSLFPSSSTATSSSSSRKAEESVAVVRESSEPYFDFRESMIEMIVEKELYTWHDLNYLLHRFLSLNSPHHHPLIIQAFADVCNVGVFSPPR